MSYGNQPLAPAVQRTAKFVMTDQVSFVPPNDHILEGMIVGVRESPTGFIYDVKHSAGVERNIPELHLRERHARRERFYRGQLTAAGVPVVIVVVGDTTRTLHDENGYEDRFDWGYECAGSEALARALTKDVLGVDEGTVTNRLTRDLVLKWPRDQPWTLLERHLRADVEAAR